MVDLIPRSVLFGNPERIQPRISPDGGSLAWIAPKDGVLNVWVAPILASQPDRDVRAPLTVMSVYRALGLPGNTPVTWEFESAGRTAPVVRGSARPCPGLPGVTAESGRRV